jgi:hypothetical protein
VGGFDGHMTGDAVTIKEEETYYSK